jgi:response regulator RpfG family c-di-GMP phosphodiesterase
MPKMNGSEFSQMIKEIDNDTKVCFLTASEDYCCNNGEYGQKWPDCIIKKPIAVGDLVMQMNSILK